MELYIGGFAQGKLTYVQEKKNIKKDEIIDGSEFSDCAQLKGKRVLNHFHLYVKKEMEKKKTLAELLMQTKELCAKRKDLIIICDELGCGVVPIDSFLTEYRENTGRILCEIAKEASHVERVFCGMGQQIK